MACGLICVAVRPMPMAKVIVPCAMRCAEGLGAAELGVHVMREEVARMAGMHHDVGFGDRAAKRPAAVTDGVVFEKLRRSIGISPDRFVAFAYENAFDK
jgi:hypothetical protein